MGIFKRKDSNAPDGKAAGKIRNSRFAASLGILKNNQFVLSVLAVLLGVVFLIWPDILLTILVRFIGAVFILGGIVAVVMFFTSRERMIMHSIVLGVGVVMAVIGVWILISPEFLITLMPKIIGLLLLICGITSFTGTVTLARRSYSRWWISLLLSIGILAAALVLLIRPFEIVTLFVRIVGAVFIYTGAVNLWIFFKLNRLLKITVQESQAIETQGEVVESEPL